MRGIMLAIGLAFLSASFMAPARAAGPGEIFLSMAISSKDKGREQLLSAIR